MFCQSYFLSITQLIIININFLLICFRLKPPIPFISRILTRDIIIHNYKVPKGTVILLATYLSSLREENFDDAVKFVPERWLNSEIQNESSFASIPFGYGPRSCLAKNLAEMQLSLIIIKVHKQLFTPLKIFPY